jgi:hypothetical protein
VHLFNQYFPTGTFDGNEHHLLRIAEYGSFRFMFHPYRSGSQGVCKNVRRRIFEANDTNKGDFVKEKIGEIAVTINNNYYMAIISNIASYSRPPSRPGDLQAREYGDRASHEYRSNDNGDDFRHDIEDPDHGRLTERGIEGPLDDENREHHTENQSCQVADDREKIEYERTPDGYRRRADRRDDRPAERRLPDRGDLGGDPHEKAAEQDHEQEYEEYSRPETGENGHPAPPSFSLQRIRRTIVSTSRRDYAVLPAPLPHPPLFDHQRPVPISVIRRIRFALIT